MRKKVGGESTAFVEFRLLSDAVRWKELTHGAVYFGNVQATLHYFVPRGGHDRNTVIKMDWVCTKCGLNNFRKREQCFKCNAPREASTSEGNEEVSNFPSSTLLFRNLDVLTTEERVLSMLGQLTVLPIKNLKVAKDSLTNTSRGFAYVELHTVSEAMQLHDLLLSMAGNFFVDGREVSVSYSSHSLANMNSVASANAASVALAAAQWTNQDSDQYASKSNTQTVDLSSFQYDEASGYYYDPATGYYYDTNSQYFYNSKTQQYLYWDADKKTYLPVATGSAVIEAPAKKSEANDSPSTSVISSAPVLNTKKASEPPKVKEKINPNDKVKIAKKVAKEMEKWAKTLNQKKETARMSVPYQMEAAEPTIMKEEKKKIAEESMFDFSAEAEEAFDLEKDSLPLVAAYGGESDSDPDIDVSNIEELVKSEESKLIDWTKLACLLCKRQFPSKEVLEKHTQRSDLHKQNMDMLKLTKFTPQQLKELERKESGYRDRAKERREKFGQPDLPPPNRLKSKYMKGRKEIFNPPEQPNKLGIGSDNIGNKMLKAMGWTEGQGLGKKGQGMSGIIEVQQRAKSAGLGLKGASYGAGASDSYRDTVRKSMQARYNELA